MSHVYPVTYTFVDHDGSQPTYNCLIESTRTRRKQWVIRVKESCDEPWSTVLNCDDEFGDFMRASKKESREVKAPMGTWVVHRELMGGLLGYDGCTWFWNVVGYAFARALGDFHIHTHEDAVSGQRSDLEGRLGALPDPTQLRGTPRETADFGDSDTLRWQYEGPDYTFDYHEAVERILAPIGFKVVCKF